MKSETFKTYCNGKVIEDKEYGLYDSYEYDKGEESNMYFASLALIDDKGNKLVESPEYSGNSYFKIGESVKKWQDTLDLNNKDELKEFKGGVCDIALELKFKAITKSFYNFFEKNAEFFFDDSEEVKA